MNTGDTHVKVDAGIASFYAGLTCSIRVVRHKQLLLTLLLLIAGLVFYTKPVMAQSGYCDPTVPFFTVDLTGQPAGTYISPESSRRDNCCHTNSPDRCIEFQITLDPGTVAINFNIASGAVPTGAMFYQIECGPQIPVGTPVCLSGPGPHTLTFCKPGNNPNTYGIFAIPGPSIVGHYLASQTCPASLTATGYDPATIQWHDITSGTGAYDAYLSATSGTNTVTVTPQPGFPPYADYQVCGTPLVPDCYDVSVWCDTVRVYFFQYVTATINPNPANFCENDGGILLTANYSDGIGPYTFEWHSGANGVGPIVGSGLTYYATSSGNYSFVVKDSTYPHCPPAIANVVVTEYPNPILNVSPLNPAACIGNSVNMTATGADNYSWSPATGLSGTSGPNVTANPLVTTTYTIIGWNNGPGACADTIYTTFTVLPAPVINAGPDDTICNGSSTMLLGSGGLIYQWSPSTGLSNPNIANPIASPTTTTTYILNASTMTGQVVANGDFNQGNAGFSSQYTNQFNLVPTATYSIGANPAANNAAWSSCGDHTTGAGNMMIVNGAAVANQSVWCETVTVVPNTPYAFSGWFASVNPTNPATLQFSINGVLMGGSFHPSSTTCQWNQFFTVWNSGANTSVEICIVNMNTVANGNDFIIDDINFSPLCSGSDTVTIFVSDVALNISGTPVRCFNGNNGTATVAPTGGFAPYTYQWSNGATTQSISGLTAGNYCVTVTDIAACTETACITIVQPTQLVPSIAPVTNVSCFGGHNGQATANAIGGVAPYSYSWSTGSDNQTISNLSAGTYQVIVTDQNLCTAASSITITQPPLLTSSISSVTDVSCFDGSDGSATVAPSGGTPPYSYNWSNGEITTTITNLNADVYTVTITDNLGCTTFSSVTINEPTMLEASISQSTNVSCFGGSNGTANVVASGGTPTYTYSWSNGSNQALNANLIAGTYDVTVTDIQGCTATASIVITQPPLLTATITSTTNVSCFGGSNGTSTVTAAGGTANYSYLWSNGEITNTISGLTAGLYCVTITDQLGCTASTCVTITEPTPLTGSVSASTNVSCFGGNNGTATASAAGGTPLYDFLWSNSATTPGVTGLSAGTYSVTITDDLGCSVMATIVITEPTVCTSTITASTNVNCFGESNGSATVTANGGTPPYDYLWSNTATTPSISGLAAGTYNVTVTDDLGCTSSTFVSITQPTVLASSIGSSTNVSCFGGHNGKADVIVTGGTPAYSFVWSNGALSQATTNLSAGTYTVTVTDAHGCTTASSVVITEPPLLIATIASSVNVSCFGVADGSAIASASGGTAPYSYVWPSAGSNASETGLAAGTYIVTVTDIMGCTATASITITQPSLLISLIATYTDVSCFDGSDGTATAAAQGGTPPYDYLWSNAITTALNTGLNADIYSVTITDDQGCTAESSVEISEPTLLVSEISLSTNVSCFSGTNGTAMVTASGGTPSYQYSWSNGSTQALNTNLAAGTYEVTVTDSLGCTTTASIVITEPPLLTSAITSTTNVSCFGGNNASATVTANGGTLPYTYLWSSGGTASTESNLSQGSYTVTVTDQLGCTSIASVTITQPTLLTAAISSSTNVSCYHGNNGSATVVAAGGTPFYAYHWVSGGTESTEAELTAGTYGVTITDALGCTAVTTVIITEPTLLTATITATTNVSCFTGNNGSATVAGAGGTNPYSYLWSSGSTNAVSGNLTAGTYTVIITDALGCTAATSVIITEPTLLTVSIPSSTNVSCYMGNDGTASALANGGTPPYSYLWSNGGNNALIAGLTAGTYTVTSTDALGCTAITSIVITEPPLLTATITSSVNASCFSFSDGSATVAAAGGTPPYLYNWTSGGSSPTTTGLSAGLYTVTITDNLACTAVASILITEPALLTSAIIGSTNISCFDGNDGSATVAATGGTLPYDYLWSNAITTNIVSDLTADIYSVTITDAQGCTSSSEILITEPPLLTSAITSQTDITCFAGNDGTATVTPDGGTSPYTYVWSNLATTSTINNLIAGTYDVTITDAMGCSTVNGVTLTEPTLLTASVPVSVNVTCFAGSDGNAVAIGHGGVPDYTYLWSNGMTTAFISGLTAGSYNVTITDSHGCTATSSVLITQPTLVTATITSVNNASCNGIPDGSATVAAAGGVPPYSILWSNSITTATNSNIVAGDYTVTITDDHGCTAITSVTISHPGVLIATISDSTNVSCFEGANGSASVIGVGGTLPYNYLWSNGAVTSSINGLTANTYTVVLTDAHGCFDIASVVITEPALLTSTISTSTNVSCFLGNDGAATSVTNGGTLPYVYLWSNGQTTPAISNLTAGTYSVTTTDALGCIASTSVIITQPTLLTAAITSSVNASCFSFSNGSATVTAGGGTLPYSYNWTSGSANATATGLSAGSYTVTVTDILGCTAVTSIVITEPVVLTSAIAASTDVSCFDGNNGNATVQANGGTLPYTYLWSNGDSTNIASGLIADIYSVTITDAQGCTSSSDVTISEPTMLVSNITSQTNITCFSGTDGAATVTPDGGTLPYAIAWSNSATTTTISNLTAGTYSVTITDAMGCSTTNSVTLTQPTLLTSAISSSQDVTCFAGNDGSAVVTANGGVPAYSYAWTNGANTAAINGLIIGIYSVTVTDMHGCATTSSVTINQPTLLTATITASTNASCNGFSNGAATVTAAGSVAPYTYEWSNGFTTDVINNIIAGTYTVTVTDTHSCTDTATVIITQPVTLLAVISSFDNISCFSGSDGSATLSVSGGTLPYQYVWSNGANSNMANGLSAGPYSVTITDAQNCSTSVSLTITEPTLLTSSITSSNNATCFGFNNGDATVTGNGGTLPYTYLWSNGNTTAVAAGLIAGLYTVTVTDDHNCTSTSSVTITQPTLLVATIPAVTNIACFGTSTGIAGASASGGVQPYLFVWSNGVHNPSISNLIAGTYTVTATDANGCSTTAAVTLTQPSALTLNNTSNDVQCHGDQTGSASAIVIGGVNPYQYSWNPSTVHAATVTQLMAGTYTSSVVDANGCSVSRPVIIEQPPALEAQVANHTDVSCNSGSNGSAGIFAAGGVQPYTYNWIGLGNATASASNLPAGNFTVVVTDQNQCSVTVNVTIGQPDPVSLNVSNDITVCQGNIITITASGAGGTAPYSYNWDNGLGNGQNHNVQVWNNTTYNVTVQDAQGCTTQPGAVTVSVYPVLQVELNGPSDICITKPAILSAAASGGDGGPYVFTWNNGIGNAGSTITVFPTETTTYIVGISDGCGSPMVWDTITVIVHENPTPNFTADKLFDCESFTTNFVETTLPPFAAYYWDFGDPHSGASNNSSASNPSHYYANTGHYTVTLTVTDSLGCVASVAYQDLIYLYGKPTAAFSWAPTTVTIADPLVEFTNESIDADTYDWNFDDASTGLMNTSDEENPTHIFSAVDSYDVWLVVENRHGCKDSTMGEIIILDLYTFYAPNAFTPNEDGVNDFFIPQSTNLDYTTFEFYVYDRWGELIYQTDDPNAPWDGKAKTSKKFVQQDVYSWIIFVSEMSGRKHQYIGHVTVVR